MDSLLEISVMIKQKYYERGRRWRKTMINTKRMFGDWEFYFLINILNICNFLFFLRKFQAFYDILNSKGKFVLFNE